MNIVKPIDLSAALWYGDDMERIKNIKAGDKITYTTWGKAYEAVVIKANGSVIWVRTPDGRVRWMAADSLEAIPAKEAE